MSTIAQVKKAMQPLLQRNPDLALVRRLVVLKPVHHILRGIHVDGSGPWYFTPTWTINVLFAPPAAGFDRIWGARVYPPRKGLWLGNDPAMFESMCEQIERVALPLLRQVHTLDDFAAFNSAERFPGQQLDLFPYIKVFIDIAQGDIDTALKFCESVKAKGTYSSGMPQAHDLFANTFYPMLAANDRAGLAKHLKENELWAVEGRKLEKFWEPTPFPLELRAPADDVKSPR